MSLAKLMVPIGHPVIDDQGRITRVWEQFFRTLAGGVDSSLVGVMYKTTYDPTASGSVVDSNKLQGHPGSYYLSLGNSSGSLDASRLAFNPVSATSAYEALPGDEVRADATSAAFSVFLPPAADSTGTLVIVTKVDASANAVTVTANGAETINGSASYSLATQWASGIFSCNGTSWVVAAKY